MITRLSDLADLVCRPSDDEPVLLDAQTRADLARCRLDVPVQKLRAYHVASKLRGRLGQRLQDGVSVKPGVTRGLGLVEAFAQVSEKVEAGWQLQGVEWRMAVRVAPGHPLNGRSEALGDQRAEFAEKTGWVSFDDERFIGCPTGPQQAKCHFGGFKPDFAHRYAKVPDITVAEVIDTGERIIDRALEQRGDSKWSISQ